MAERKWQQSTQKKECAKGKKWTEEERIFFLNGINNKGNGNNNNINNEINSNNNNHDDNDKNKFEWK